MYDLHSMNLFNFRSYRGEHDFVFPTKAGLYYLSGENKDEPLLGSNGAGKSTFLDAITWILYGRTTRGLKAGEVITWGAVTCHGTLELTIGVRLTVKRSQKPNGIFLNGNPVDQEELDKHLCLNFEAFLCSVLNPQFGQSFFELMPSAKLTLFSDIMKLDYWIRRSHKAAIITESVGALLDTVKRDLTFVKEKIKVVKEDVTSITTVHASFDERRQIKIDGKCTEIASLRNKLVSIEDKLAAIKGAGYITLSRLEASRDNFLEAIRFKASCISESIGRMKEIKSQIENMPELGSSCSLCHQQVGRDHVHEHLASLQRGLDNLELKKRDDEEDLVNLKKYLIEANQKINRHVTRINEEQTIKSSAKVIRETIARMKNELKELREEKNPHEFMLQARFKTLESFEITAKKNIEIIEGLETEHAATEPWIAGFKRVRLFVIERAFQTLELEVNNCLTQLGMPDWQVSFDIERENKSGGITRGFVVFIKSPFNEEPVRWENWSGGESQRLQLAGDLGLSNLIMQQNGLTNSIEMFDEPSTHLSVEGMLDLANVLHERAVSENKRIWIIDHTSISNFGEFEGVITVRKDANGSSILYKKE